MIDLLTLSDATDNNQLGAHLCRMWDKQRASGMISGKWLSEMWRFVTLEEWFAESTERSAERMNIGDKVTVRNRLTMLYQYVNSVKRIQSWRPFGEPKPVSVGIYLGTVTLYNGARVFEGQEEGYIFNRTGQVSAVVVQPLDTGGRYRRPVYALPEDVEAMQP